MLEETSEDFAVADAGEDGGIKVEGIQGIKEGSDDVGVVGEGKFAAADDVDVELIEFAEATLLGAFATEINAELGDFEWKGEVVFVLDYVTG